MYPLLSYPKTPVSLARPRAAAHPQGDGRGKDPRRPGLRALLARSGAIIGGEARPSGRGASERYGAPGAPGGAIVRLCDYPLRDLSTFRKGVDGSRGAPGPSAGSWRAVRGRVWTLGFPRGRAVRKIAVTIRKGGTGKTTTAVNLSHALALAGRRVLLVDTDAQGQVAHMLGVAPELGLADVLAGRVSALAAVHQARDGLDIIAGGPDLVALPLDRSDAVRAALRTAGRGYDFVIVDTAPGFDMLAWGVLHYAVEVLAPVSLEPLTLFGLVDFRRNLEAAQKDNRALVLRYVVPTFADGRVAKTREILADLEAHFPDQLCAPIRYNVRISEAPAFGQTVLEYAPRSHGADDYRALAERIAGDGKA